LGTHDSFIRVMALFDVTRAYTKEFICKLTTLVHAEPDFA